MTPERESERFDFVLSRDGVAQCAQFCRQAIRAYRAGAAMLRRRYGRRAAYRREWILSAWSLRRLAMSRGVW